MFVKARTFWMVEMQVHVQDIAFRCARRRKTIYAIQFDGGMIAVCYLQRCLLHAQFTRVRQTKHELSTGNALAPAIAQHTDIADYTIAV
jgi:hypothetical protein